MQATTSPNPSLWERFTQTRTWQTFRASVWLEWQSRGNWTNPALYLIFLIARPISAALVLVFMYRIASGQTAGGIFGFLIVGSAAWSFVEQIMAGLPQAVLNDREEYAMLKYVYIAPQSYLVFLVGRSIPRMLAAALSFIITVVFGVVFLGVPVDVTQINLPLLLAAMLCGLIAIVALGIAFAGLCLMLKRGAYQMPEAITGSLYLVAGAIFPIAVLPGWLETLSLFVPLTYWLELTRRSLLGSNIGAKFPIDSTPEILGLLVLTTVVTVTISIVAFKICEGIARERGQIDRTTGS